MPLIRSTSNEPDSGGVDPFTGLSSTSSDERWAAARAAANIPESVPALAQALIHESEPRVREAIFTALVWIKTPESALAVLPYLRSDDANIRTAALDALRAMPEAAKPYLPQMLVDADGDVRLLACDLTRDVCDADTSRWLCTILETEPLANVCAAAVEVLADIGDAQALPTLWRCAARFPADPFLHFAIRVTADRLGAKSSGSRG